MTRRVIDPEAATARRQKSKAPNRQERDRAEIDWWQQHLGKELALELVNGKTLVGTVKFVATYTLCLELERNGGEALILKHAIAFVRPDLGQEG